MGTQDFAEFKRHFDYTLSDTVEYEGCLSGSHPGLIHKYATIGDGIYSSWDYEDQKSYTQANFYARFAGELLVPWSKVSMLHKSTAQSEVAKQKLVYP